MVETKQLRILKAIADVGSFTAAAEHLGISQPTISQQIRALEEQLGVSLFARVGRATRITPAGEVLLECATQVLDKLSEAQRRVSEQAHGRAGLVRIGTPEPPCNYLLPAVLVALKHRYPEIDVRVVSGHTAETLARLNAGQLDLALLPRPFETAKLRAIDVGRDELVAIVPPGHVWATMPFITARDFERWPLLVYDRASQITEQTFTFLLAEGVFPRVAIEIDHLEAVKDLVQRELGVAVVPRWAARRELAEGRLAAVRLGIRGCERSWSLLQPDIQPYPAGLRALTQLFAEALPPLFAADSDGARGDLLTLP